MAVYDQIKTAFPDIIAPELHAIRGDIRLLDQKMDALRTEFTVEIRRVDTRIEGVNTRLDGLECTSWRETNTTFSRLAMRSEAKPWRNEWSESRP